jgi:hypothetical protein
MAWYPKDDHDSTDVVDEASVGLMVPKSESATRNSTEQRHSWISKSILSIVLILSNVAWASICIMLWRELHLLQSPDRVSDFGFEADFGTFTSNT